MHVTVISLYMSWGSFLFFFQNWHPDTLSPYQLETDHTTDTFNFMVYVKVYAACLKAHFIKRFIGSVLASQSEIVLVGFDVVFLYIFFVTAHFQLISSTTGHTKLINFLLTTPFPKWCGCSPRPGAQCGNDPRSKVAWPVPQLRQKDCSCTIHRFCDKKGPAVTGIYRIYKYSIYLNIKRHPKMKDTCPAKCTAYGFNNF